MEDTIGAFGFWLMVGASTVAIWWAMGPIIKALADRIAGRNRIPADLEARLQALESRSPVTGETDAVYHRLVELEERLEFAERLLAQTRPEGALPPGEGR
ncbi:MAG TPA: hypothetical protein VG940_08465 [Gemmatimonadales bacterium]|nr:hypothetical protein [Gemmatimonadales bacterium]